MGELRLVAALWLLATLARLGYTLLALRYDPFIASDPLLGDAASYDRVGWTLARGGGYGQQPGVPDLFWPPLYPLYLGACYGLFGHDPLIPRLAQAPLQALVVPAVYLLGRLAMGRAGALLAALGMGLHPLALYFGAWLTPDGLYVAAVPVALLLAWQARQRGSGWLAAACGVVVGLAALAKPAVLFLGVALAAWTFGLENGRPARRALATGLFGLGVVAAILPWSMRNLIATGELVLISNNGGYTFYGSNNAEAFGGHVEGFPEPIPGLTQRQADQAYYRLAFAWISEQPAAFGRLVLRKLARMTTPLSVVSLDEDYPAPNADLLRAVYRVYLFCGLGGLLLLWRRRPGLAALLATPIAGVVITGVLYHGDTRFTLPATPSLVILASYALVTLAGLALPRSA